MMQTILLISSGGVLGALCRYFLGLWIKNAGLLSFPISTLIINALGSFAIGCTMSVFKDSAYFSQVYLFAIVGFLGAFTTFSTFSFETLELFKKGANSLAILNIFLSVSVCLIFVFAGDLFGKWFQN